MQERYWIPCLYHGMQACLCGTGILVVLTWVSLSAQIARKHAEAYCQQTLGYKASNMRFVKGHIELLDEAGIASESMDLIISNCVINLSPDKGRVIQQAYRVLASGGEMYFSDVYCNRRVPKSAQKDEVDTVSLNQICCFARSCPTARGIRHCLCIRELTIIGEILIFKKGS